MSPSYPNFAGKHDQDAFFNPSDFVAYTRSQGRLDDYVAPDGVILCYQRSLYEFVLSSEAVEHPNRRRSRTERMVRIAGVGGRVGVVGDFGIGAPAAAGLLEDLIALGTTRFISIGTAGSLQRHCPVGHIIVCDRAIRDEGVSHHYLPSATYASAGSRLTGALISELDHRAISHTVGASWTIDTPYRETVAEARHYQAEGVLCVEMEAAALFTVAEYRGAEVASAFAVSDSLADLVWDPQFHSEPTARALTDLYHASVAVLAS